MNNLTKRQDEIVKFIRAFKKHNGYPPTRHEIAEEFGFKSDNAAQCHLMQIEKKGYITVDRFTARGIYCE